MHVEESDTIDVEKLPVEEDKESEPEIQIDRGDYEKTLIGKMIAVDVEASDKIDVGKPPKDIVELGKWVGKWIVTADQPTLS